MFKSLREKFGRLILRSKLHNRKREKSISGFEDANLIGVLFKTHNINEFNTIKDFLVYLKNFDCKVVALCYIDSKKVPDYYLLKKGFNFFTKNDINFFLIPTSLLVNDFIDQKFDILIDLTLDNVFPIEYIVNLSKAKFKIGKLLNNSHYYDLMIDISKNHSINNFIDNVKYYLPLFTSKSTIDKN